MKKGQDYSIQFQDEWVHKTEIGVNYFAKEEINEVSSEPFLAHNVTYPDKESGRSVYFSKEFSRKFGISLSKSNIERQSKKDNSMEH